MKAVWIAAISLATSPAWAQSTIYKHVDEGGRVTYSNKPMKGASVLELEPLTTIPGTPTGTLTKTEPRAEAKNDVRPAIVTPVPKQNLASVEPSVQKRRDDERRRILEDELAREEKSLDAARNALVQEQQNPVLIAAVRMVQQAADPSPSQQVEMRNNLDKASGKIRGLQATVAEHEKNVEALKKELGALKP